MYFLNNCNENFCLQGKNPHAKLASTKIPRIPRKTPIDTTRKLENYWVNG